MEPNVAMGARIARGPLLALALAAIALHLAVIGQYGYFRDELYYLASTRHLAFGYVDHPPFSIALLAAVRALFGDSLFALRIVPVLAGAAMVVLTGLIARELGAGVLGQSLAALCVIVAPMYLASHHFYSMNALDQLTWTLSAFVLVRILKGGGSWILFGVILGLGLENKISALWLAGGIAIGLVLTPHRSVLFGRGPWLAAAIAVALFAPHVAWQAQHGWPTREFIRNAAELKNTPTSILEFLGTQVLAMNPVTAPVWIAGVVWCFVASAGKRWRILAIAFLAVLASFAASGKGKVHYFAPAYPPMFAAGATAIEAWIASRASRRVLATAMFAVVVAFGALVAPMGLPLLPVDTFVRYMHALGMTPRAEERSGIGELPQHYADMFGWDELSEKVALAYRALPAEDRARCSFFAQNYGEAGALDVIGPRYGLPEDRTLSGHNSYWLWGPRGFTGDVMIVVGGDLRDHRAFFESVERVDVVGCERCMPYERDLPIYVCRGIKAPLADVWPRLKHFI